MGDGLPRRVAPFADADQITAVALDALASVELRQLSNVHLTTNQQLIKKVQIVMTLFARVLAY
jgi:hypothetical protein